MTTKTNIQLNLDLFSTKNRTFFLIIHYNFLLLFMITKVLFTHSMPISGRRHNFVRITILVSPTHVFPECYFLIPILLTSW